jgi:hypothetical protein
MKMKKSIFYTCLSIFVTIFSANLMPISAWAQASSLQRTEIRNIFEHRVPQRSDVACPSGQVLSGTACVDVSTLGGGGHCGGSRFDIRLVLGYCQGHDPILSCPSGYRQMAVGWRAGGYYTCVPIDPALDYKNCPVNTTYIGDFRKNDGVYVVSCQGNSGTFVSHGFEACLSNYTGTGTNFATYRYAVTDKQSTFLYYANVNTVISSDCVYSGGSDNGGL